MSSYLTRIEINPRRRASGRTLASPHRMHGAVNACFPPSAEKGRTLWRVDRLGHGTFLYVVSEAAPDATGFVEEHGWPLAGGWQTRDYAPVLDAVQNGSRFSFRLAANPVHTVMLPGKDGGPAPSRGKRLAHVTAAQQLQWFHGRAESWGFSVDGHAGGADRAQEDPRYGLLSGAPWSSSDRARL